MVKQTLAFMYIFLVAVVQRLADKYNQNILGYLVDNDLLITLNSLPIDMFGNWCLKGWQEPEQIQA